MSKRIISPREFARLATDGSTNGTAIFSDGAADDFGGDSRTVSYVLSDNSVARDGHTIATDGWQLDNFRRNPVFLFAHDTSEPPVGQFTDIGVANGKLRGTVLYADAETYPFADTIYRLVQGKFLRAVSVSWDPLKWKFSTDKSRPGGIDFLEQDLLEVSQVPVPAAPGSLAQARSAGIDTTLLYDWAERVLDTGETVIVPRAELEALRREAKMPTSKQTQAAPDAPKRGLWTVAYLAELLQTLGWIQEETEWETAYEEDNSPIPGMLAGALKNLGEILIAMTVEEVGELVGGDDTDVEMPDEEFVQAATTPAQRLLRAMVVNARASKRTHAVTVSFDSAEFRGMAEKIVAEAIAAAPTRAGRVLSSANEKTLREAHETMTRGCDMVRAVIDQVTPDEPDPTVPEVVEQDNISGRERLAIAAKRRIRLAELDEETAA